MRVAIGPDPVSGRSRYRSLTVHGDREAAQAARERWAAKAELGACGDPIDKVLSMPRLRRSS